MIIYPALDLRGGKVVRLRQGDPRQQTVYSDDPLAVAQRWIDAGARGCTLSIWTAPSPKRTTTRQS